MLRLGISFPLVYFPTRTNGKGPDGSRRAEGCGQHSALFMPCLFRRVGASKCCYQASIMSGSQGPSSLFRTHGLGSLCRKLNESNSSRQEVVSNVIMWAFIYHVCLVPVHRDLPCPPPPQLTIWFIYQNFHHFEGHLQVISCFTPHAVAIKICNA